MATKRYTKNSDGTVVPASQKVVQPIEEPIVDTAEATQEESTDTNQWPELDKDEIDYCKKVAGGLKIYQVDNAGQTFVIRPLRVFEWADIQKKRQTLTSDLEEDELIARAGTIWPHLHPEFWKQTVAGQPATLAVQIRQKSGFTLVRDDGTVVGESISISDLSDPNDEDKILPTEDQINEWRKSTPTKQVFEAVFPDGSAYYFRPLMRLEWLNIQAKSERDPVDGALEGCKCATIFPEVDWDNIIAGKVDHLFDCILKVSGFSLQPQVMEL